MRAFILRALRLGMVVSALPTLGMLLVARSTLQAQPPAVTVGADRQLEYNADDLGNRVPDFSNCGYVGADREIPDAPARVTVAPTEGDDGPRIQAAIDQVAALPLDANGLRGAVLLAPGEFQVAGQININASGVVLRGSGVERTTLIAAGPDRRALVRIAGVKDFGIRQKASVVVDGYAPVGTRTLKLSSTAGFQVGDTVFITRPSTAEWTETLGMRAFGVGWRPGSRDIRWDRVVTDIDGDTISLDAPITTAIEKRYGGATVASYDWPGRIENVGIEDLRMESAPSTDNPLDEDHAWHGVTIENAQNAWVRRVEFLHFAGGAVALWETTKWVTVEDCIAREPISELGGYRRHTFFTQGQLTLFLRCWSENGRHDFAVGHCAAGPNAFVNCYAAEALGDSGPIESWASGVLYDNVRIDGAGLNLENRWVTPPGTGWSAANSVIWQCRAPTMRCFRPPGANNWAIGVWTKPAGDGTIESVSDFVKPQSLYQAQLRERLGRNAGRRVEPILGKPVGATNPTLQEAAEFVANSNHPARQLVDVIRERMADAQQRGDETARPLKSQPPAPSPQQATKRLMLENGWLVIDGAIVTGNVLRPTWWRGTVRPDDAPQFGPAITRFVPGRVGTGFTDDLEAVADGMQARGVSVYDHHYGLWYDRRRDDHLMVRRADGDVAPPFYEQPFARSGEGTAWDGLSKYDLTKFNAWYWNRLHDFAQLCDERGLVFVNQNYFQHNILEAGAHWVDCPWRSANNVNDTGIPEPPPFVGDKRLFQAHLFYDVSDPRRRALHRAYIRQCLDAFADCSNVIQMTSAEFSGPLEFVQFWLDTIAEWEKEHGQNVFVGLSAPKNVQDAILADEKRSRIVDVIDIRYWTYMANGELYAPEGGLNLAPRQHMRQLRPEASSFDSVVRAVREYRTQYPEKAVTYFADEYCRSGRDGWAVLAGGGSLPNVKLPEELAQAIKTMRPADGMVSGTGQWCLASPGQDYLVYMRRPRELLDLNLAGVEKAFQAHWINPRTGNITTGEEITGGGTQRLRAESNVLWLAPNR